MREWCACGSGINTLSKRQVKVWRTEHKHADTDGPDETTSQIGFAPNEPDAIARVAEQLRKNHQHSTPISAERMSWLRARGQQ